MDLLKRALRRSMPYLPFTQPRYRGTYPFIKNSQRVIFLNTNRMATLRPSPLSQKNLLLANYVSPLSLYEDRRRWSPYQVAPARSMVESYPRIVEKSPRWKHGIPYNPETGEIQKLVPSKIDPSGYRYITDRPGVLEKFRLQPWKQAFENPWKVIICLKRKMRKEVMNALGYAGNTGFKKRKFNQYSYVRCF